MKHSKALVSGKDINEKKNNLGLIRQPLVDDFMDEMDIMDFIKPFYLQQLWLVTDEFEFKENTFTYLILATSKDIKLLNNLYYSLELMYPNCKFNLTNIENKYTIIIKNENDKAIAFIDDSNFEVLSSVVLDMCYFKKPKPIKKKVYKDSDEELIKIMEEAEKRHAEKLKDKKSGLEFEEMVRVVMNYRKISYKEISTWSVWQLNDAYIVESLKHVELRDYLLAGQYKVDLKKTKMWQKETNVNKK